MNLQNKLSYLIPLASSLILIFYKFTHIPKYLFYDEVDFAKLAISLSHQGYIAYSTLATGHSTLYFYVLLVSLKFFGLTAFALRLPAALFGVGTVIIFSKIFDLVFNEKQKKFIKYIPITIVLGFILISSRWYLNFSRFAFEAIFLLFLESISLYVFIKFINEPKLRYILVSGIFAGLAFHSYYPGRIFFLVPLIFLVFKWKQYIIPYFLTMILVASPLIFSLIQTPDMRFNEKSYMTNSKYDIPTKLLYFVSNAEKNISMLVWDGDMTGRHNYPGKPALNIFLALTFFGGLLASIRQRTNHYVQIFFIYLLISLIPTLFTPVNENPNMLRTFTMIPSIVFFIGIFFIWLLENSQFKKVKFLPFIILAFVVISSFYELRTYFVFQPAVFEDDAFKKIQPLNQIVTWEK